MGVSALYPRPPQPQQGILQGNPLSVIGPMLEMQQFRARQAAGQAFQGAISDGQVNPDVGLNALANTPAAAMYAPETALQLLASRRQNTENAQLALNLGLADNQAAASIIAQFAQKPNPTQDDVNSVKAQLVRARVPSAVVAAWGVGNTPQSLQKATGPAATYAMGPAAAAVRIPGPPGIGGAPTTVPVGATVGSTAAPGMMTTGLPPGQAEAATGIAGASAAQANTLMQAADTSPTRKGMLGNLETDLQQFTAGPGADWTKVAKAWANRNVLPSGMQFDPASIASQEAFTKQAEQLAQQQFAAIGGTGTDAKFGSAFKSNPNETLSSLGNTGIIRLLKGNEDAIQAKNRAWQQWLTTTDPATGQPHPPQSYPQFAAQFNASFDPRIYQSQYMSKDDLTKMGKPMSPAERQAFAAKVMDATRQGYIAGPGAYYGGQ